MSRRRLLLGGLVLAISAALYLGWPPLLVPLLYPREQAFLETAMERIFTMDAVNAMPLLAPSIQRIGGGERVRTVQFGPWEFEPLWPSSGPRPGDWLGGGSSQPAGPATTPVLSSPR